MANILDYLAWRGDLTLEQAPLNDVDGLILSWLSYIPFGGIVSRQFSKPVLLSHAAEAFLKKPASRRHDSLIPQDLELLRAMGASRRFGSLRLCGYYQYTDHKVQSQFAALAVALGNGSCVVSYRGTDDTLVGWKEDLNMAFLMPVPSQLSALRYLERVADVVAGALVLGGHSKGGNLAAYAAALCPPEIQDRIVRVFCNDSPGFPETMATRPGYQSIRDRLRTFVPQSSVIGMLLEHEEEYTVVHSHESGIMQHSPFSWDVLGDHFVCVDGLSRQGQFVDKTLNRWLAELTPVQRERVVDTLYAVLDETQATTVTELTDKWLHNAGVMHRFMQHLDEDTRRLMNNTFNLLLRSARRNVGTFIPTRSPAKTEE